MDKLDHVSDFIKYISEKYKDNVAFEIRRKIINEKVYYQDLQKVIKKTTDFLKINDVRPGDKILIWGLNCPEYAILLLSLFSSSRVAVPIDFRSSDETIEKIFSQTKPKAIWVSKYLKSNILSKLGMKQFIIEDLFRKIEKIESSTENYHSDLPNKNKGSEKIAEIVYTSGTTGEPKGVVLTEKAILENAFSVSGVIPKLKFLKTISILPLSHMLEQIAGLFLMLRLGATIVYLPKINSSRILASLQENKISHLVFVPQLFNLFFEKIEQKAFEKNKLTQFETLLKISKFLPIQIKKIIFKDIHKIFGKDFFAFVTGGAPLNLKVAKKWEAMGFQIFEGYGATEVTAIATINRPGMKKLGSAGKPISLAEISFDNDKQIVIKSSTLAKGYFNNEEKTKKVFKDGRYFTGDLGEFDKEGYLHILGRDVFKIVLSSGEKIYVEDLEAKINTHPLVKESCVVEVLKEEGPEAYAFVILNKIKSGNVELSEVMKEINLTLDSKQQIRNYSLWSAEDFPRTHTLKINRNLVKRTLSSKTDLVENNDSHLFNLKSQKIEVKDIISNISGIQVDRIKNEDNLSSDLEMDSISRIELVSQIEEYLGVLINEADINYKTTVFDIEKLVTQGERTSIIPFPTWHFSDFGEKIGKLARKTLLFPLHSSLVRIKIDGIKNIKDLQGGFIAAFNHAGILDGVCVERSLAKLGYDRFLTLASKNFWVKNEFINKITRIGLEIFSGGLPLYDKGFELIQILQKSSDLMERGYVMLYAPQGKLQRSAVQDSFNAGVGYVAKELKKPIVPFKLIGYEEIWPAPSSQLEKSNFKNLLPKKRGEVIVKIGMPVYAKEEMSPQEIANFLEEKFDEL